MKRKAPFQLSLIGQYDINLGNRVVPYTLKRSSRARMVWLRVKTSAGLTVTVPWKYQIKYIPAFLRENSAWILRHLDKCEQDKRELTKIRTPDPDTVSYLGHPLTITRVSTLQAAPSVRLESDKLILCTNDAEVKSPFVALEKWMREQAAQLILQKAKQFSSQIGVVFNRITIRDQRSRWGSCSHLKNLSFCWRLVMAPEPVIDYVVIHELCHLKEMNHSRSFWSLVGQFCPQWKEQRRWLNKHGKELRAGLPG